MSDYVTQLHADERAARRELYAAQMRVVALEGIIRDAQLSLAKYLEPGGPDEKTTLSDLLGILDGSRAREALQ